MHDIIGNILGVDTQIIFIGQRQKRGLMGGAQADFHGGTVFYKAGNQPPDVIGGLQFRCFTNRQQRFVVFHKYIHVVNMNKTAAQHAGHMGIHLGDHQVRRLGGRQRDIDRYAQAHPAEIIRRRHLNQGDMNRQQSGF